MGNGRNWFGNKLDILMSKYSKHHADYDDLRQEVNTIVGVTLIELMLRMWR